MTRNLPQNDFLGHIPINHQFTGQAAQVQRPFLEPKVQIHQPFSEPQSNQKQIMELLLTLNQRMTNLEKQQSSV